MGPGHTLSPCSEETKVGTEVLYEGEYKNGLYLELILAWSCVKLLLTVVIWDMGQ